MKALWNYNLAHILLYIRKIAGFIYLKMTDFNIHIYYYLNLLKLILVLLILETFFFLGTHCPWIKLFFYSNKVFLSSAISFYIQGANLNSYSFISLDLNLPPEEYFKYKMGCSTCYWSLDRTSSISYMLGLQSCASTLTFIAARYWIQGILHASKHSTIWTTSSVCEVFLECTVCRAFVHRQMSLSYR